VALGGLPHRVGGVERQALISPLFVRQSRGTFRLTERQVVCCGPAGSGFAEDIFGFHKGLHPESGDRLITQIRYELRDYGTGHND